LTANIEKVLPSTGHATQTSTDVRIGLRWLVDSKQ
jgi:hypothetical protein